jgi:osmotically-inducible protein OsmY
MPLGERVKTALLADARLGNSAIAVKAAQGVVTLYGTTDTSANRDHAARIAYTVQGTRYVKSNLLVTSGR